MPQPQNPPTSAPAYSPGAPGKRARDLLRRSENRYRRLFETARDGILLLNADTAQIEDVNPYLIEMLGYSHGEFLGKKLWEVGSFADIAESKEMFSAVQTMGYVRYEDLPLKKKNGQNADVEFISNSYECDGKKVIQCNIRDISERKSAEKKIELLAFFDSLTGLPNRSLLLDRLRQALVSCTRTGRKGALLFIDLDDFKTLNDTLGHHIGDLLLQKVAHRLTTRMREGDTVARLGGDEFVVVLNDLSDHPQDAATQVKMIGKKILSTLNRPYVLASLEHNRTASIGATLFGDNKNTTDELLKQADIAMYQAKADGRDTLCFFDPNVQTAVKARAALETELRQGIKKDQFVLHFQPQMDDGRLVGAEALIRWRHPKRGLVSPSEFIPLAEEIGQILPLGNWVLETACIQMAAWARQPELAHLTLAVNVSARQFLQSDFVANVLAVLERTGADPKKLKLELTESIFANNVPAIIAKMNELKAAGLRFSLDDFGIGYSSLSYLKHLPLSQLKIDKSFVQHVLTDSKDATIARAIVALGQGLDLAVIAEGIETEAQRLFFADLGCRSYQGYLFGHAIPANEFAISAIGRERL
ncbi:EAL and GGDEF domain-containing protein [Telmatospirillum siberiense]|uniref:Diguanylate cyclase n=1 Tax=Telmatospirillum siberiense TaxID=382514 RepID=A0A2N3PRP4_9PROT|nr:EAL domain-containing protein [Telmatospirillum siberiense]PKU23052.1 diguanylate cyclase [Telmatospirillum siberiense]